MSVKSADRTLKLFELFAAEQKPLTISEIARNMDLPQSSTSMITKSLTELGYLEHDTRARTYYPTFRIALLGTWMRRRHERTGRLPQLASKLAEETGETVVLAMRNGIFAQYAYVQIGPDPLRLHVESGMQRPLACCSSGWALLSFEADSEVDKIIRRTQAESATAHWRETAGEAVDHIAHVRKHGWVRSEGHTSVGAGAIAMLLPAAAGRTPMSIAVGGPIERIKANHDLILDRLDAMTARVNASTMVDLAAELSEAGAPSNPDEHT